MPMRAISFLEEISLKEKILSGGISVLFTTITAYLGGWDIALKILVFCMVADYATGLLGAIRSKSVDSEVMFWGGVRKGVIFVVIALAVMLDEFLGNQTPVFRMLALYFYVGREGLSIVENLGILGVPLPAFVARILGQLQEKGDTNETG